MNDFGLDEYDYMRAYLFEALLEEMSHIELMVILDHAEHVEEFLVSIETQLELRQLVKDHYGY